MRRFALTALSAVAALLVLTMPRLAAQAPAVDPRTAIIAEIHAAVDGGALTCEQLARAGRRRCMEHVEEALASDGGSAPSLRRL